MRDHLSDVIDPSLEGLSLRKKDSITRSRSNTPGNKIQDPYRCALCGKSKLCPRDRDIEDYALLQASKCLSSSDPVCSASVKNPANEIYIKRILSLKK